MSATLVIDGAIARVTLERPEALNALDASVAAALEAALERLERARDVTVAIVSGRGWSFCAGNDIAEMAGLTASAAEALSERWQGIMDGFARLPHVTLAAVRGFALGGGCMLALAQDLRVAERSARFGLPEITLGFNPSYGIARMLDVLGGAYSRDLLLTGRTLDSEEALRIGLATRVVPDGGLEVAVSELAAEIARHPRAGLAAAKAAVAAIRAGQPGAEARSYAALVAEPEARGRIAAFLSRKSRPS
jgi:enoyl-CoA hydratase/carnithine racemase